MKELIGVCGARTTCEEPIIDEVTFYDTDLMLGTTRASTFFHFLVFCIKYIFALSANCFYASTYFFH